MKCAAAAGVGLHVVRLLRFLVALAALLEAVEMRQCRPIYVCTEDTDDSDQRPYGARSAAFHNIVRSAILGYAVSLFLFTDVYS